MNRELARVLNAIVVVVTAAIVLSWGYTFLNRAGIQSFAGINIYYGFFAVQSAMITAMLILIALHCRNRIKLGDKKFRFPMHGLGALSFVGIYDTAEAILSIGEDLSLIKLVCVSAILIYIIVQFIISIRRNEFA